MHAPQFPAGTDHVERHDLAGYVREGTNVLRVGVAPSAEGEACGVYVRGRVSQFDYLSTSKALPVAGLDAVSTTVGLDSGLDAGSVVRVRQSATNKAGLASTLMSEQLIMLDDTPPRHPRVVGCTPGGRDNGTAYFQTTEGADQASKERVAHTRPSARSAYDPRRFVQIKHHHQKSALRIYDPRHTTDQASEKRAVTHMTRLISCLVHEV